MRARRHTIERINLARLLRRYSTDAEEAFWYRVRAHRFENLKFRRQVPFGPFILDFYCPKVSIAVEIDGDRHFSRYGQEYDAMRSAFIASKGIRVIRYSNDEVLGNLDCVMEHLWEVILTPTLSFDKERG